MARSTHSYKNPKEYSQHNKLQFEFAMEALHNLEIKKEDRVLDLGCGDGVITSYISDKASMGCVIGTDISQQMVDYANIEYKEKSNLRFMQMDAGKNVFKSQFDIVTSFNALHWVHDQAATLQGIADSAVEGARILLLLSHRKSLYHHTLDKICSNEKWKIYFKDYINPRSFFSLKEYSDMLSNANLNIIGIIEKEMSHNFQDAAAMKSFFRSSMSQVTHVPQEKREEFLDDFTNIFLEQLQDNGITHHHVSFWCLQVNATKPSLKMTNDNDTPVKSGIFSRN